MSDPDRMAERDTRRADGGQPQAQMPAGQGPAQARVWVLDDLRDGGSAQALGIAERLGVPFRRVPLAWNWLGHAAALSRGGSLLGVAGAAARQRLPPQPGAARPLLVLSAGRRSAAVALWLKTRLGCRVVHCLLPGVASLLGGLARRADYDLLVIPEQEPRADAANVLPVLGTPHRIGPQALRHAAAQWGERLDHLPHPRVALLVGGPVRGADMEPARAHALARSVARVAGGLGGSVLASTSRRTGREASDALAAGLSNVMHLLYRWGEPGENPYLGFLAAADAVVVTGDSVSMLSEACSTSVPVYVALPELAGARQRRFLARMTEAGQVRPFRADVSPWPRTPLDEAGRVAAEIRNRFAVE